MANKNVRSRRIVVDIVENGWVVGTSITTSRGDESRLIRNVFVDKQDMVEFVRCYMETNL